MRATVAAMVVLGVVAAAAAVPAAGQQERWDARELRVAGGGKAREFRLRSDNGGSTLILQCVPQGAGVGFEFAEPIEPTQRVTVRGVPGQQRNIAVQPVGDRVLRLASGQGRDFVLRMLRDAASIAVRTSGQRAGFDVFGSDPIVSQCIQQQDSIVNAFNHDVAASVTGGCKLIADRRLAELGLRAGKDPLEKLVSASCR